MSEHQCHAKGCKVTVHPRLLMCIKHWRMVPHDLQQQVYAMYRPGQETDKEPSPEYLAVMQSAIESVAVKEGRR